MIDDTISTSASWGDAVVGRYLQLRRQWVARWLRIVSALGACAALIVYGASTALAGSSTTTFTTTTLDPAYYGTTIELIASVTTSQGTPVTVGTVTFYNGNSDLGTVSLDSSGYAVLTLSNLPVGSYDISAVYNGTSTYNASASSTFVESVQLNPTWVVLSASQASPPYGADETLTAQIGTGTGTTATPTGTMTFLDGSSIIASVAVNGWSVSTTVDTLPLGSNSITAAYSGDQGFEASTSPATTVTVSQAATSLVLSATPADSTWGSAVTVTAAASAQGSVLFPTGTVTFTVDGSAAGSSTLSNAGAASLVLPATLSVGTHTIGASYAGNADFAASTASPITVTIAPAGTSTSLTASASTATVGAPITFTASVQPTLNATLPSGTVSFYDGTNLIGTGSLTSKATASLTTSTLTVGSHTVTAVYGGNGNYAGSTSPAYVETITLIPTTVALSASPSTAAYGTPITLTAQISSSSGSTVSSGTVTFANGSTTLGSSTVSSTGTASLVLSNLVPGTYSLTATYSGSSTDGSATSAPLSITVTMLATSTSLSVSATSAMYGTSISATATVTDATGAPVFSGNVTFADGTTVLGNAALNSQGTATLSLGALSVGQHSITATFSGNADDASSTSSATGVSISQATTSLSLVASAGTVQLGNNVSFTATVTAGTQTPAPTGTVTFSDGTTILSTTSLSSSSATYTTSALAAGVHAVSATYSGDATYIGSTSATVDVTVNVGATSTAITAAPSSPIYGESVTLSATVSGAQAGFPLGGTVSFLDGSAVLGTVNLGSQGTATLTVNDLALGTHILSAQYNGSSNYGGSTSAQSTLSVGISGTTTAIGESSASAAYGSVATFTATVTAPYAAPGSGNVTFLNGSTVLGTVALGANGTASFTTSSLGVGSYDISASFGGTSDFAASSSAGIAFSVTKDASTTTVAVSPQGGTYGSSVTISAHVTAVDSPTGSVTFTDSSVTLATIQINNGTASFTYIPGAGSHTYGATYSGDGSTFGSTAIPVSDSIARATPAVNLAINPEPALVNEQVTLTASLVLPQGTSATPTGTFAFAVNGASITPCTAVGLTNGLAQCVSVLPTGTDTVTATYSGDDSYMAASASGSDFVGKAATTVALTSALQTLHPHEQDRLTATVTSNVASVGTPTGTVRFSINGTALQGCLSVLLTNGTATCSFTTGTPGTESVTATYSGSGVFLASSGNLNLTVGPNHCDLPGRGWHFGAYKFLLARFDCTPQPPPCDLPHMWQCIDHWIHAALSNDQGNSDERANGTIHSDVVIGIHSRASR